MTNKAKLPQQDGQPMRKRPGVRAARGFCYGLAGLLVLVAVAAGGLYLRLAASPLSLADYKGRLEDALSARLGAGWRVAADETALELYGGRPAFRASGLEIRNPVGITVVRTPWAAVSLNPLSLLAGRVSPRDIELRDVHLRGVIAQDGTLSFSSPHDGPAAAAIPPQETAPAAPDTASAPASPDPEAPSVVSTAVASLMRPLVESSGLVGALDRARLVDARLSLLGHDGRERVAFRRVNALFEHDANGDRRFDLELQGERGEWHVHGTVGGGKGHPTAIEAEGVPLADIMLLTGLSRAPVATDVKLSASLATAFGRDRLDHLSGRLRSSAGTVTRQGRAPVRLDGALAELRWDEASRTLAVPTLSLESDGTRIVLDGSVLLSEPGRWRIRMAGRDVVVAPLDSRENAFRLGRLEAEALLAGDSISLEKLSLKGEGVEMAAKGRFVPGSATEVLSGTLDVARTDVRRLVRLWPDSLTADLRAYLAERLLSGTVDRLTLSASLDPRDVKSAFSDSPMTDRSVSMSFAASGLVLSVVDGLPALRNLSVEGKTSGTTVSLKGEDGVIEMPDGRRLDFHEASYLHLTLDQPGSAARIAFRTGGGLDALASFFRSPLLAEAGLPHIDPATVRGRLDIRATLPLVPGTIPALPDLAMDFSGTMSDVAVDKLPGKERLEGGTFTVSREAGQFAIKGDGRLNGTPANFDLRLPSRGPGELLISATLDEAARGRRGLPVGPLLTGPVAVKVTVPLGAKGATRVEADLGRAGIEGLLPGWQKAPGRPGKLSFVVGEGGSATELRELSVDAGSVQIRGHLTLGPSGSPERAEIASLKLSPGDEMKAQFERAGGVYRLAVRGNNIDARPLLKWLNAPAAKGAGPRDKQDFELDIATNILSGFNDEAMTGVSVKGSIRDGELRSLQFGGRFRSAAVEGQLGKRDSGAPILALRSGDAGATLRFLDLYRRMNAGRLAIDARMGEGVQDGRITIEDFALQGEPALRRLAAQTQQSAAGASDERGGTAVRARDIDQVAFNRLTTAFRRQGARMDYTDAVIYGPQVGFNLSGFVDHARDRLDVTGTFVPVYMLNNAFSQIPLVGLILGGGYNEGLIAVEFRVAGAITNPSVTVNPLTVVAPGILRKLFGWMQPEGQAAQPGTSAANEAARTRRRAVR